MALSPGVATSFLSFGKNKCLFFQEALEKVLCVAKNAGLKVSKTTALGVDRTWFSIF